MTTSSPTDFRTVLLAVLCMVQGEAAESDVKPDSASTSMRKTLSSKPETTKDTKVHEGVCNPFLSVPWCPLWLSWASAGFISADCWVRPPDTAQSRSIPWRRYWAPKFSLQQAYWGPFLNKAPTKSV